VWTSANQDAVSLSVIIDNTNQALCVSIGLHMTHFQPMTVRHVWWRYNNEYYLCADLGRWVMFQFYSFVSCATLSIDWNKQSYKSDNGTCSILCPDCTHFPHPLLIPYCLWQVHCKHEVQTSCTMKDLRMFANTGLKSCEPSSGQTFSSVSTICNTRQNYIKLINI